MYCDINRNHQAILISLYFDDAFDNLVVMKYNYANTAELTKLFDYLISHNLICDVVWKNLEGREYGFVQVELYITKEGKEYVESLSSSEIIDILFMVEVKHLTLPIRKIFDIMFELYKHNKLTTSNINFILSYKYIEIEYNYLLEFIDKIKEEGYDEKI